MAVNRQFARRAVSTPPRPTVHRRASEDTHPRLETIVHDLPNEQVRKAQLTVCRFATDTVDALMLLQMVGIAQPVSIE